MREREESQLTDASSGRRLAGGRIEASPGAAEPGAWAPGGPFGAATSRDRGGLVDRLLGSRVVRAGVVAGLVGGMMMALWTMVLGAIARNPTAVAGIHQSFWTPVTSIASVVFGKSWFHGSFEFWAVFLGLMGHMMNSAMAGVAGVALSRRLLGDPPNRLKAMVVGVMMGLLLEVVVVKLAVNHIQDVRTLDTSIPDWGWWVGHVMFGATVGLVGSTLLLRWRRQPSGAP